MIDTKKLLDWLGVTLFEIWMFCCFLIIFLILLICKLDELIISLTWFNVFLPLFIHDCLAFYFCLIIFIRQYINGYAKQAFYRALYSFFQLSLIVSFKISLLYKIEGNKDGKNVDNHDIFMYIGALMVALLARLCTKH